MYNCHCCYQCQSIYVNPIYLYEQLSQKWRVPECFEVNDYRCHILKGPHWVPWRRLGIVTLPRLLRFAIFAICKFCLKRNYELQIAALDNHYLISIFIVVTVFWIFLSKFCSIFLQLGIACHCCLLYVCSATEDQERRERGHRVGGGRGASTYWRWGPPSWSMSSRVPFHIWYLGVWDTYYKYKDQTRQNRFSGYQTEWGRPLSWSMSNRFLDALASLDFKLSLSEWVTFLQLAHLRVFQSYLTCLYNLLSGSQSERVKYPKAIRI